MLKVFNYVKYIGMFILFIIIISIIASLFNLMGFNSNFMSKITIILTALGFFVINALASKNINEKGYILGIKLGLIFVILMILINLVFFKSPFSLERMIYYIILIFSSILGGSFGKNLKTKKLA